MYCWLCPWTAADVPGCPCSKERQVEWIDSAAQQRHNRIFRHSGEPKLVCQEPSRQHQTGRLSNRTGAGQSLSARAQGRSVDDRMLVEKRGRKTVGTFVGRLPQNCRETPSKSAKKRAIVLSPPVGTCL
jgi:hypothetical protein